LIDAERAGLHDALFQAPTLTARVLKIQIGVVSAMGADLGQGPAQLRPTQTEGLKQQLLGHTQAVAGAAGAQCVDSR
jgi:hypothetical protein